MVDGHVGLVLGGAATYFATINATMPKGWVRTFIHREPMVAGGIGELQFEKTQGRARKGGDCSDEEITHEVTVHMICDVHFGDTRND